MNRREQGGNLTEQGRGEGAGDAERHGQSETQTQPYGGGDQVRHRDRGHPAIAEQQPARRRQQRRHHQVRPELGGLGEPVEVEVVAEQRGAPERQQRREQGPQRDRAQAAHGRGPAGSVGCRVRRGGGLQRAEWDAEHDHGGQDRAERAVLGRVEEPADQRVEGEVAGALHGDRQRDRPGGSGQGAADAAGKNLHGVRIGGPATILPNDAHVCSAG